MTDLCAADTSSPSGSVQIRASRSDLSIANSSPRLESNATTSNSCSVNDVQPMRRDLSSELLCPLCDQLFDRPVMVTCGHSYCEPCIERHTRNTRNCVICKNDVGPLEAMIPSITLDNMVRKLKNTENIENSYDDLFICEEKVQTGAHEHPKVARSLSQRSKPRLFFSIAAPTICSSPITPHRRRPLSPSARPSKSALKNPPESLNYSVCSSSKFDSSGETERLKEEIVAGNLFRRNGFGRRSERFTSTTQAKSNSFDDDDQMNDTGKSSKLGDESTDGKLKRNSFFRRSLNAIRSKTSRRSSFRTSFVNSQIPEEDDDGQALLTTDKVEVPEEKTKNMKSLWRRLFVSSKKGSGKVGDKPATVHLLHPERCLEMATFIRLENKHDDPLVSHSLTSSFALGYYTGIGRKFERVANGSEITLVVFGHAQSGKTTFVRAIRQLFLEGSDRIRLLPNAERYKLAGIGVMPYPEGDNRLPHIVSLVIRKSDNSEQVLDIIDPEYDNSYLPQAYMDACDAAIFLIDARNCASLLSAHQIQRNLKTITDQNHVQYEMVMNVPSADSKAARVLSSTVCETMAKKQPIREMSVSRLENSVMEEMLISICDRVLAGRQPSPPSSSPTTVITTSSILL